MSMNIGQGHHGTLFGTIGGTLLSVSATVAAGDLTRTAILGMVGAVTSFACSYLLKEGIAWIKRKGKT
ncbi:MAG: hypothetical protein K2Q22_08210 [Cytophagales bacterium]|nr:hypothetical protein [Cytophagales bacterium]